MMDADDDGQQQWLSLHRSDHPPFSLNPDEEDEVSLFLHHGPETVLPNWLSPSIPPPSTGKAKRRLTTDLPNSRNEPKKPCAQLPPELLDQIAMRLTDPGDLSRFGQVSLQWHSIAAERRRLSLPPPLLMMDDYYLTYRLFGLAADGTKFRRMSNSLFHPNSKEYYFASMGWLFVYTQYASVLKPYLINPVSGKRIQLPRKLSVPITYAGMSSAPSSADCVVVVAAKPFVMKGTLLAMCRPGSNGNWNLFHYDQKLEVVKGPMIIYKRQLYLHLGYKPFTAVFDVNVESGTCLRQPQQLIPHMSFADNDLSKDSHTYFVESDGELLWVSQRHRENSYDDATFCVFKLEGDRWIETKSLSNWVLLLSDENAESISSKETFVSGFQGNCIYYYYSNWSVGIRIYSMGDGSTRRIPLPDGCCNYAPAYWMKPQVW